MTRASARALALRAVVAATLPAAAAALAASSCSPDVWLGDQGAVSPGDGGGSDGAPADAPPVIPPVRGAPCPDWVHDRFTTTGPDGRTYAAWHPSVDPGSGCTFGHEHGDDPTGAPALRGRALPFGYATAQAGRTADNRGFKVFRYDSVATGGTTSHDGASLLVLVHQGTGSDDVFRDVFHEVAFHYVNPRDGREVHVQMMAPFGGLRVDPCDPAGGTLIQQADVPGERRVPGTRCFGAALDNAPGTVPGSVPYEDWFTALYIAPDGAGWRAYLDPHFAVADPNAYCALVGQACALGRSDERANTGQDPLGPRAQYKGVHRVLQLNQVALDNAGGATTIWTDPYGHAAAAGAAGAIAQFVSAVAMRALDPSTLLPPGPDPDPDGSVHAPN